MIGPEHNQGRASRFAGQKFAVRDGKYASIGGMDGKRPERPRLVQRFQIFDSHGLTVANPREASNGIQ